MSTDVRTGCETDAGKDVLIKFIVYKAGVYEIKGIDFHSLRYSIKYLFLNDLQQK